MFPILLTLLLIYGVGMTTWSYFMSNKAVETPAYSPGFFFISRVDKENAFKILRYKEKVLFPDGKVMPGVLVAHVQSQGKEKEGTWMKLRVFQDGGWEYNAFYQNLELPSAP